MPALPPAPNVLRIDLKHTMGADLDVLTRSFWQYTGTAPTNAALNTMAAAVATAWGTNIKPLAGSAVTLVEVVITDLSSSTAARGTDLVSIAGTRAGNSNPAGTALQLNFAINRRYRGGKPRTYNPWGVAADTATLQTWSSTFRTACTTGWGNFATAVIAAAPSGATIAGQVNVSYYDGFTVVTNPITGRSKNVPTLRTTPVIDAISSVSATVAIASQRRRNRSGV